MISDYLYLNIYIKPSISRWSLQNIFMFLHNKKKLDLGFRYTTFFNVQLYNVLRDLFVLQTRAFRFLCYEEYIVGIVCMLPKFDK